MTQVKLLNNGTSNFGDSGGPYFQYTSGGVSFCGVHCCGETIDGYRYTHFTPYTYVHGAGFTINTN